MYAFKQESPIIFEPPTPKLHLAVLQAWACSHAPLPPCGSLSKEGPLTAACLLPAKNWTFAPNSYNHLKTSATENYSLTESSAFILDIFLNLLVTLKKRFILVKLQCGAVLRHKGLALLVIFPLLCSYTWHWKLARKLLGCFTVLESYCKVYYILKNKEIVISEEVRAFSRNSLLSSSLYWLIPRKVLSAIKTSPVPLRKTVLWFLKCVVLIDWKYQSLIFFFKEILVFSL